MVAEIRLKYGFEIYVKNLSSVILHKSEELYCLDLYHLQSVCGGECSRSLQQDDSDVYRRDHSPNTWRLHLTHSTMAFDEDKSGPGLDLEYRTIK